MIDRAHLAAKVARASAIIDDALERFGGRIALASSFGGPAGMAILDMVAARNARIPVYFLDTGLLFEETYALVERVRGRYGIEPIAVKPGITLEEQAARFGPDLWARDPDACCSLRKVAPHRAFLNGYDAWFSGIRRDQSPARESLAVCETDADGRTRVAPLADWNEAEVWEYLVRHNVPHNELADRGYSSIGCRPCTRPIVAGEGARSGRWDGFAKTECGIHARP